MWLAANFSDLKSQKVSSSISEKNGAVDVQSSDESSTSLSTLTDKSNQSKRGAVNMRGSVSSSDVSSSRAPKSRRDKVEQSSDKRSDSLSASEPNGMHDALNGASNSSAAKGKAQSISNSLNNMALDVRYGNQNNVSSRKANSKLQYKHEKWMLPDQAEDTLIQLNLAIVSLLVVIL